MRLSLVMFTLIYALGKCTLPIFAVLGCNACTVKMHCNNTIGNSERGLNATMFRHNSKKFSRDQRIKMFSSYFFSTHNLFKMGEIVRVQRFSRWVT